MWTKIRWLLQEESDLGLHCLSKWLYTSKADDLCCICALSVNKCNGQDFHKMQACLLKQCINFFFPKR